MRALLMGIDIGSTNVRSVLFDTTGRLVAMASRSSENMWATRDDLGDIALTQMVIELCDEVLGQINGPFHLYGIAVASVGCGTMPIGRDGKLVKLKGDHETIAQNFFANATRNEIFNTTGYPRNGDNIAFRLAAHQQVPGAEPVDAVLSIASYVAFRLTGEKCTELSTYCSMGVWDNHKREWWGKLLDATGVDARVFGTAMNNGAEVGSILPGIAERSRIPRGTKVYVGGHDYLCSAFATGCDNNKTVFNITGTYEIMATFHNTAWQRTENNTDPIRPLIDNHVLPGKYSYQLEAYGAGQTEWLRKNIFAVDTPGWSDCFTQLEAREQRGEIRTPTRELFIPHVYGQIVPAVDMRARGAFLYLTDQTDRVTLLKAAIEGLCYQSRQILEAQRKVSAHEITLKMVGGGIKSPAWVQAKADILNIPVIVPNTREATALGAAMLAGVGAGVYATYADAMATVRQLGQETIHPRKEWVEKYDEIYHKKYLQIIEALKS